MLWWYWWFCWSWPAVAIFLLWVIWSQPHCLFPLPVFFNLLCAWFPQVLCNSFLIPLILCSWIFIYSVWSAFLPFDSPSFHPTFVYVGALYSASIVHSFTLLSCNSIPFISHLAIFVHFEKHIMHQPIQPQPCIHGRAGGVIYGCTRGSYGACGTVITSMLKYIYTRICLAWMWRRLIFRSGSANSGWLGKISSWTQSEWDLHISSIK